MDGRVAPLSFHWGSVPWIKPTQEGPECQGSVTVQVFKCSEAEEELDSGSGRRGWVGFARSQDREAEGYGPEVLLKWSWEVRRWEGHETHTAQQGTGGTRES